MNTYNMPLLMNKYNDKLNVISVMSFVADKEHNILDAVYPSLKDSHTVYFDIGYDKFPAYGIMPGADIKEPYRLHLPERLYPEFSISCTISIKSTAGGFIFAVVNPMETVRDFNLVDKE